jgi:hypothetical protein
MPPLDTRPSPWRWGRRDQRSNATPAGSRRFGRGPQARLALLIAVPTAGIRPSGGGGTPPRSRSTGSTLRLELRAGREHIIRNDGVGGSNPSCGTSNKPRQIKTLWALRQIAAVRVFGNSHDFSHVRDGRASRRANRGLEAPAMEEAGASLATETSEEELRSTCAHEPGNGASWPTRKTGLVSWGWRNAGAVADQADAAHASSRAASWARLLLSRHAVDATKRTDG